MVSESLTGETSLSKEFQALSISNRLVRNPSPNQKQKKNNTRDEVNDTVGSSWKCLTLNGRGGGCKVVAETNETFVQQNGRRRSSSAIDCFSHGMEKFWKKNCRKSYQIEPHKSVNNVFLSDDILEMCLVRLPLTSLMNARLVCKKWRYLTTNPRFIQMRQDGLHQFPWVKDGSCSSEIHSLDVHNNQWHKIDASILKGRFMFSVASVRDNVYIVGGCSSLTNFSKKTHKGVILFRPLSKSWHKIASMKYPRSSPILGTCPQRLSGRRIRDNRRFVLIVIGGVGSGDERLYSGEIYDSSLNKWAEIQRMPIDFGIPCSGVVCNWIFYVYSENDKLSGFDVERGYWISITTVSIPPRVREYYPKLICSNGRLFMLSVLWCEGDGEIGRRNKAVRKVWELDFVDFSWSEVSTHPDAPMDWNAAFVSDRDAIFGVEMFKIFGQVLDFMTVCDVSKEGGKMIWRHVSTNKMGNELDASSCVMKSIVVVYL